MIENRPYYIRTRAAPRKAHLNLNVRSLGASSTLAINEHSAALQQAGKEVYRFGLGQSPFPVPDVVVEALRCNAHQKDYLPVKGLPQLRQAVSTYHARSNGIRRSSEDVLVGPGSKELMFILQLTFYGDLVMPAPSWVSYMPQASILGRQVRWIGTDRKEGWRLTPEALEAVCVEDPLRPRLLILNYPNNPCGVTYSVAQLKALAEVARRYSMIVLSDEIYSELHFEGRHVSIARFYPEGTIVSSGLSKWAGAGGWRLGTFLFPPELNWLLEAMAVVASETYTSVSAPIQYAAVKAYEGDASIDRYLSDSRRILKALGLDVATRLRKAGCEVAEPEGGFYLLVDFSLHRENLRKRGVYDARQLSDRLLEEAGVAALPGSDFGLANEELILRIAYVDFDGDVALAAAVVNDVIDEFFLHRYCPRVMEATRRVCDWLG